VQCKLTSELLMWGEVFAHRYLPPQKLIINIIIVDFFKFTYSLQLQYEAGFDSTSNRNEYQKMFPRSRARPALIVDNLTAIYEPIV
jgi:hypothetical protein